MNIFEPTKHRSIKGRQCASLPDGSVVLGPGGALIMHANGQGYGPTDIFKILYVPTPSTSKVGDVITDLETLERLPARSVVLDAEFDAWQRRAPNGLWLIAAHPASARSSVLINSAPLRVLYIPEQRQNRLDG